MGVCDICNRSYKTNETLRKHKIRFHTPHINSKKIHQPYEEMSNEQIAARYLNTQKDKLDKDTYEKLKLKLKGLKWFKPEPYHRKPPSSDDGSPTAPMKPSKPTPAKRKRSSVYEDKATPDSPPESEDSDDDSNDDASDDDELKKRDELSREHINCVTIGRFMQVRNLIRNDDFDTLSRDVDLVNALQVIIKGVLEGFIPICSAQRMVLTPELKFLMNSFSRYGSPEMIMKHRDNLKLLFEILDKSIKFVVDTFNRFAV